MSAETTPRKRVLVAEDDAATRLGMVRMLTNAGLDVVEAEDGVKALAAIRENSFDLVFLDIWMPKLSGLEVL